MNNKYWNKDNFEGLLEIAKIIKAEAYLADYREYIVLTEKGLRKKALEALRRFVAQMRTADFELQKKFVRWLLDKAWTNPEIHQLIPYPLLEGMIKPCLQIWKNKEQDNPVPYRWAGIYLREQASLEKACALDNDEQIARYQLIDQAIATIEYNIHHLPDDYIGDPNEALGLGERAKVRIDELKDANVRKIYKDKLNRALRLVKDWVAYNQSEAKDFDEWCRKLGRHYQWGRTYYYND